MKKRCLMFILCFSAVFISAMEDQSLSSEGGGGEWIRSLQTQFATGLKAYDPVDVRSAIQQGHWVLRSDLDRFKKRSLFRSVKLSTLSFFQFVLLDRERAVHFYVKRTEHQAKSVSIIRALSQALESQ